MRVFLVEDDDTVVEQVEGWLSDAHGAHELIAVRSRASAIAALTDTDYDLVICDLRIPPNDGSMDEREEFGLHVHQFARQHHPGTPCLFFTGHADDLDVYDEVSRGGTVDLFGSSHFVPMVQLYRKLHAHRAGDYIADMALQIETLEAIDIEVVGEMQLNSLEARAIRIFARRQRGTRVHVTPLGGLSGTKAFRLLVHDQDNVRRARVFGKIGDRQSIADEERRFQQFVTVHLDPSHIPSVAGKVLEGCGSHSALFFSLADQFSRSMFDAVARDETAAVASLNELSVVTAPWADTPLVETRNIGDLRKLVVSNDQLAGAVGASDITAMESYEAYDVPISCGPQHGDLHGGNILVDDEGHVMIIDFGDVDRCALGIDPLILEMSLLFHPDRPGNRNVPTNEDGLRWTDLEYFCSKSPFPQFARTCRQWMMSLTDELSICVLGYVHALRQLKYRDTNKGLALAIATSCRNRALELS